MAFDRIIGHHRQRQRLMDAVKQDRLAHGYLFCGPPGVGAEALAIELACAVNCESGPGEPCGQSGACRHCRRIRALQHPDVHLLVPASSAPPPEGAATRDRESPGRGNAREERRQGLSALLAGDPYAALPLGKNDILSVDDIRSLRRDASVKPYEGRKKVAVIVAAERMNTAAANALLKTLEEPPGTLMLILTAVRSRLLLPTILSRCQPVSLPRLHEAEVTAALTGRYDVEPDEASLLARRSEGRLAVALSAMSEGGLRIREDAFALLECIHDAPPLRLFEQVESLAASHREEPVIEKILDHLLELYRDLFILSNTGEPSILSGPERRTPLQALASRLDTLDIEHGIAAIEEARRGIALNAHVQLALLVLVLRLRLKRGSTPSRETRSGAEPSHTLPATD
ncbi:MAG: hypothetical protein OXG98_12540 [Gemmatimonadetes bacterium]|nr:hypothetical protein [Gemmatimonadota bacterium]